MSTVQFSILTALSSGAHLQGLHQKTPAPADSPKLQEATVAAFHLIKYSRAGFSGGLGVENPPANAGDTGLIPGPGIAHMLWATAVEPVL